MQSDQLRFHFCGRLRLANFVMHLPFRRLTNTFLLSIFLSGGMTTAAAASAGPIGYGLDLRSTGSHLVQVAMSIPDAGAKTEIQFPTWNALYQMRDFVKDVQHVQGECDRETVGLDRLDLNTWRGPDKACKALVIHYSVYANQEGPFDSILNSNHAFLNLAMVLFYLPHERDRTVQIKFQLPAGWKLATLVQGDGEEFQAANYDELVDSPVDAGHFEEMSYSQAYLPKDVPDAKLQHASIRVIIDANPSDYSSQRILDGLRKITTEETALMQDLPFDRYSFILQFPRDGGSTGGMEHRNGTAISIPAADIRGNERSLESVAAHEFFHLWNVKRIRPQALEPVNYVKGNDTSDLWFSEGVTNSYAELALLRAGLIDRKTFYARVAIAIESLESREGRRSQSAEISGREAWLEKYSDYNRADRSISYYNKGELLGYVLDLGVRHATNNQAGLDDVMRRLNRDFAQRGRYFTMADVAAILTELAPSFDTDRFFAHDVRGTGELDFATCVGYAGLTLTSQMSALPVPGFSASRNAKGLFQVDSVDAGSDAEQSGLAPGDVLVAVDGKPLSGGDLKWLPKWQPGQTVEFQAIRNSEVGNIRFEIGVSQNLSIHLEENPHASRDQVRVRDGWLKGITHPAPGQK